MESEILFTATDNSIDVVGALFFLFAIGYSFVYLWENHITTPGKIKYIFIIAISGLHVFQVIYQSMTGHAAFFRVWDFINYSTAIFFLMVAHRISKREREYD